MADALARLKAAGIEVLTPQSHAKVAAVEAAIAQARPLSMRINGWESRWPLNTYRDARREQAQQRHARRGSPRPRP